MPIKIPSDLPAFDVLTREGVMVMGEDQASRQDPPPAHWSFESDAKENSNGKSICALDWGHPLAD